MRERFAVLLALLLLGTGAVPVSAQNATIAGTVADDSKAVLPGVTVTATSLATGRVITGVTDERGEYRLTGVPPGRYSVEAELAGFGHVILPDVELLVGQNRNIPFTLQVASLAETLTVTAEAPLVDISSSQVGGNVDRRQMEELPLQGRNWMELAMQVRGITANAVDNTPGVGDRQFQLALDGQEITQQVAGSGFGQPKFSREAIAEFQIITNLFDVTQGRSLGIQVQAISRSGTNNFDGAIYGYFRDSKFNSADFITGTVLPYSNQQIGATLGGPIVRDRAHFFMSVERENEPNTIVAQPTFLPGQRFEFDTKETQNSFLSRVDWQTGPMDNLTLRTSYWDWQNPFTNLTGETHPSQAADRSRKAFNTVVTWAKVLNNTTLQEVKIGYTHFNWKNKLAVPSLANTPNYVFPGLTIGQPRNFPQEFYQNTISARYDLTATRGRHDLKLGGEFLRWHDTGQWQLLSRGEFIFDSRPGADELLRRFPADAWDNPSRWDVSGLDGRINRFSQNYGDWTIDIPRPTIALWVGDTIRVNDQLTVNLGVRWDADWGAINPPHNNSQLTFNPVGGIPPFEPALALQTGDKLYPGGLRDLVNIAPRGGFTWNVGGTGRLVIRGGSGLYFSIPDSNLTFGQQSFNGDRILVNSYPNDGLPGFITDPTRGVTPEQVFSGQVPLPPQSPRVIAADFEMPYSWQSTLGMQMQIRELWGFEADITNQKNRNLQRTTDPNVFYNPANGYNLHPTSSGRPDPRFTSITYAMSNGYNEDLRASAGITRRYRNNWQGGVSYTLRIFDRSPTGLSIFRPFEEYGGTGVQRHTVRMNGLVRLPYGISFSGAYFYGSGTWSGATLANNPFGTGVSRLVTRAFTVRPEMLDRWDGQASYAVGEVIPRSPFKELALHRLDVRTSKEFTLPGGVKVQGIAELFNVLNHENHGSYNTNVISAAFGDPRQNLNSSYQPRKGQLAFKVSF